MLSKTLVERVINWAALIVLVGSMAMFARRYLDKSQAPTAPSHILSRGDSLTIQGVDWAQHKRAIVLGLQVGCHFCEASAPFYRQILSAPHSETTIIAVLPQPQQEAESYLTLLGIRPNLTVQANFAILGITATPTLAIVDALGRVQQVWRGQLKPDDESAIIKLSTTEPPQQPPTPSRTAPASSEVERTSNKPISAQMLRTALVNDRSQPMLDVRSRSLYAAGHIAGTINIPADELAARVIHEVRTSQSVIVYCHYCSGCESRAAAENLGTSCSSAARQLSELGYQNVQLIGENLETIRSVGVLVMGSSVESDTSR